MAKVGEGDPRWIVSERTDGANVNSWHWEERDLSQHTYDQLKGIFASRDIPVPESLSNAVEYLKIEEVSEISGDVTVAQRKGKMMSYFELKLQLRWTGKMKEDEQVIRGKLDVAEVDHDEFKNDYEIHVTCQENSANAQKLEGVVRDAGRTTVRKEIEKYFNKLFKDYHIGEQLKSGTVMPPPPPTSKTAASGTACAAAAESTPGSNKAQSDKRSSLTKDTEATSFSWKMRWRVPVEELYAALTDPLRASAYTRSAATMDVKAGGQFSFLGGVISGYYVDVQPPTLLKLQWRLRSWPVGVHSSVVMQLLKEEPGVTILEFAQSGIPAGQLLSVQEGWRANFFDAIKAVFGYSLEYL
ncbi:hypothetical protein ABL78_7233 [Leptomonas seymouri]|uniref:Activator of Hsp90 ATPase AHSA1-like N-terminal domain-containing protein n=1 Tax=Leptomonas seymouri TaxID=5684 RepID=A0A0N1I2A4_LEPSE|nr:hypothetical protein ABL78_7233 [Leptomonas seymouri]|eukprot:KPI83730.1 hypothetical protein ABL78_7233 [Leptomonas seymouri]